MGHTTLIDKAFEDYQFALHELMRPEEDVVLLSACLSAKKAIRGFLSGYLDSRSIPSNPNDEIETLMARCVLEDPNFLKFDIEQLNCKCEKGNCSGQSYCMTLEKVTQCLDLVARLGAFILSESVPKKA